MSDLTETQPEEHGWDSGKPTERTQAQELTAFSGSVLIRAIDPETSYIDSLSVVLFYADGSYFTTDQGNEAEINFEEPANGNFERAEITAHGYYEPY